MNTCIAYFSKSGNTKIAAEYLAEKIGAKAIELTDSTNYKGVLGFIKGGMNASIAKKAKLDSNLYDEISKYDRIVLATPVWAGKTTPAINAVIENVDWQGKQVYAMTTQADSDCKDAPSRERFYKEIIEKREGKFITLFSLCSASPGKLAKKEDLVRQVDEKVKITLDDK